MNCKNAQLHLPLFQEALDILEKKGHVLYFDCYIPSGFHAISVTNGSLHAYTDWKKFGCPDGF
jgi:hypothetical protein